MKYVYLVLFVLLIVPGVIYAAGCVSGNCSNGYGTYVLPTGATEKINPTPFSLGWRSACRSTQRGHLGLAPAGQGYGAAFGQKRGAGN